MLLGVRRVLTDEERDDVVAPETKRTVLVIDDEPLVGSVVKAVLRPVAEVELFESISAGIERLQQPQVVDLVLCDLSLPGETGSKLYTWVAEHRPELLPRTGFITGGAWTGEAATFLDRVAPPHLLKPFTRAELLGFVEQLLANDSDVASSRPDLD
jgi:CheY-like chemotaxis protein